MMECKTCGAKLYKAYIEGELSICEKVETYEHWEFHRHSCIIIKYKEVQK